MAELHNVKVHDSNVTIIEENHDLDRIADLMVNYTKDVESIYENSERFDATPIWVTFLAVAFFIFINAFMVVNLRYLFDSKEYVQVLLWSIYLLTNSVIMLILLTFFKRKQKEKIAAKDNLQLSHNRLAEVIQFASQTLEHTKLTDIRTFEFKLLLKQAEDVLQKTKNT